MSRMKLVFVLVAFPGLIPNANAIADSVDTYFTKPLGQPAFLACLDLPGSACCSDTDDMTMNTTNLSLSHNNQN